MAHDDDPVMLALGIIFPIISITSVILRFEARRLRRLKLEADDWTILAALVNFPQAFHRVLSCLQLTKFRFSALLLQSLLLSVSPESAVAARLED